MAVGLLGRAVGYALGSVDAVGARDLSAPTPCAEWDLRALLEHVNDSLDALREALATGTVGPRPVAGGGGDPVAGFRDRACRLLVLCAAGRPAPAVLVGRAGGEVPVPAPGPPPPPA